MDNKGDKLNIEQQIQSCGFNPILLDAGTYGTVFSVSDYQGTMYALKYIKEPKYTKFGYLGLLEIDILRRIQHPHVIHAINIITSITCNLQNAIAIVMPLADTTLAAIIPNPLYSIQVRLNILYKLATGLDFLHRHHILHLDIKTTNIVLKNDEPYFIDFGLSLLADDIVKGVYHRSELVSASNRPPEIFEGSRQYNAAVDVWAYGIVILWVLTGQNRLFPPNILWNNNAVMLQALHNIVNEIPRLLAGVHDKYRNLCISLVQGMLRFDPKQRLTMVEVIEHPVFDDVRTLIVGNIVTPLYVPKYADQHRAILKLMLVWAREIFGNNSAHSLLLAIDIYKRADISYQQKTTTERMALAAMSLIVAMKLLDQQYLTMIQYKTQINKSVPDITVEGLLLAETEIVYYLGGVLVRSPFFEAATTGDELILALDIILDHDDTLYLQVDYDSWNRIARNRVMEPGYVVRYPSRDITINRLLNY